MHEQIMKKTVKKIIPSLTRLKEQGITEGDFHVKDAEFTSVAIMGAFQEIHEFYSTRHDEGMDKPWKLTIDLIERLLQTKF